MRNFLKSIFDLARVARAAGYSFSGLRAAFAKEAAFRQEVVLFLILAPIGVWLGADGIERSLLVGSLALVLIAELLNSAVEAVVDRVGHERHELAGRAKDLGSAAVFIALMLVVFTWGAILGPRYF